MSRFKNITDKSNVVTNIQKIQINIKQLYNKLTGNVKHNMPITKIERQFYRRQIMVNMIKYSELIEEFEQNFLEEEYLPYLDFIVDYYLDLSEEVDEFNKYEIKIEKILGLINE